MVEISTVGGLELAVVGEVDGHLIGLVNIVEKV
jgi:hypothetical protein